MGQIRTATRLWNRAMQQRRAVAPAAAAEVVAHEDRDRYTVGGLTAEEAAAKRRPEAAREL